MLFDTVPELQNEGVAVAVRIVGTLSHEEQVKALKLLKAKGALEDSRNRYTDHTKLWCGHPISARIEVPDGRKEKTQICSVCEPEPESANYLFRPFNARKPK